MSGSTRKAKWTICRVVFSLRWQFFRTASTNPMVDGLRNRIGYFAIFAAKIDETKTAHALHALFKTGDRYREIRRTAPPLPRSCPTRLLQPVQACALLRESPVSLHARWQCVRTSSAKPSRSRRSAISAEVRRCETPLQAAMRVFIHLDLHPSFHQLTRRPTLLRSMDQHVVGLCGNSAQTALLKLSP